MTTTLMPDICVIGGGADGFAVAAAAAAFGVPVVLVDRGGGDAGSVRSIALAAAARHAQAMRHGSRFGIADAEPGIDFRKVARHVGDAAASVAPDVSAERLTALGVRVLKEQARFRDRRTLVAGQHEIRARRFVVATGSLPAIPPIPGIGEVEYLTEDTVFGLTRLPRRLIVIGGGPAALALAQSHRRLGSEAVVIEEGRALAGYDPELAAVVLRRLRAEGVEIRERTTAARVERRGKTGVRVVAVGEGGAEEAVDGTHLLVAAGRRPDLDGLDLDHAGIAFSADCIAVDDRLRTANRRVYAIGGAAGAPPDSPAAEHHAGLVARAILFRRSGRAGGLVLPRSVFTDPQLVQVGLGEDEARERHGHIRILRWPYAGNGRAQAERRTEGFVKLVAGRRGRILGVGIAGADAAEQIGVWTLALSRGLRVGDLAGHAPAAPTLAEIGKRAAISYFADAARRPGMRRIVRFLRMFG